MTAGEAPVFPLWLKPNMTLGSWTGTFLPVHQAERWEAHLCTGFYICSSGFRSPGISLIAMLHSCCLGYSKDGGWGGVWKEAGEHCK